MTAKITHIHARQVLDSRGNPTIEVELASGKFISTALVPSGASIGTYEALELRDGMKSYHGLSVMNAVHNVNNILAKKLLGKDVTDQKNLDETMITIDGTENKSRLGANAILGVSLAAARCASLTKGLALHDYLGRGKTLPVPFANIINGGKHAEGNLKFQEFMIAPIKAKSFSEATLIICEVYHTLKEIIQNKYGKQAVHVGDEGGFAPPLYDAHDAISLITKALNELGYQDKVKIALDAAATTFYDRKIQKYTVENKKVLERSELLDYYLNLLKTYPIIALEDPFDQDDHHSFQELMKKTKIQIIGDDLLVTTPNRISNAISEKLCNSLLIKPNQAGTLTETYQAASLAVKAGWKTMVSHRSGDTEDTFIADLAVALNTGQIKLGAPCRGERTSKYNQLLRIEEYLGKKAIYGGKQ
ncbi:MAG: phosphopyruvate hydratase [Candidatus Nanoarchaeia archaeon]